MRISSQFFYTAFDITVQSEIKLPELVQISAKVADVSFILRPARKNTREFDWFHHWYVDESQTNIGISIARVAGGFRLRFPALVDFLITENGKTVACEPVPNIPLKTIRHLYLDQVLPRILGQMGHFVLHASAAKFADETGVVFTGGSGWGKSTLAMSFQDEGGQLICDDCLMLRVIDGKTNGITSYAGSRLWADSVSELCPPEVATSQVAHYSGKRRIPASSKNKSAELEVGALFLVQDPNLCATDDISIELLEGTSVFTGLVKQCFLLDVEDAQPAKKQFIFLSEIFGTRLQVFTLQYPRTYSRLEAVRRAIRDTIKIDHVNAVRSMKR